MGGVLQIVATIIGVLSFGATLIFWFKGRARKGIGYEILGIEPLIEKNGEAAHKLEIRYESAILEDPHLIHVRICNAEKMAIKEGDFNRPIVVSFGSATVVPFTEKPRCIPPTLAPRFVKGTPHEVRISALDLNPGAEIHLVVLSSTAIDEADISCHTMVKDALNGGDARRLAVDPVAPVAWFGRLLLGGIYVGSAAGLVFVGWAAFNDLFRDGAEKGLINVAALVGMFGAFLLLGWLLRWVVDRRKWPDSLR